MTYPIIVNNHSAAEIIFYCRNSVFDFGVLFETLLGFTEYTLYVNFSKIKKLLDLENHLALAILNKRWWIHVYKSKGLKGNQKFKLRR